MDAQKGVSVNNVGANSETLLRIKGAFEHLWGKWFLLSLIVFIVAEVVVIVKGVDAQWQTMLVYGLFLIAISPPKSSTVDFFRGGFKNHTDNKTSTFLLASSAAISWIFAKSIYNASTLGGKYGIMGGLAYACYYTTFASVGLTAYRLRTRYGYGSLAEAINDNYGNGACVAYGLAVLFRLYQEIWSNSAVVASFYSDEYNTTEWWMAAIVSTAIPLVYTMMGGMRSAIVSDTVQMVLVVLLLVAMLIVVGIKSAALDTSKNLFTWNPVPERTPFSLEGGLDLALTGLLQGCLSYGFFDAVLVDRAFLAKPRMMLKSFLSGGTVAALFIFFFSMIGIYGNMNAQLGLPETDRDYESSLAGIPAGTARSIGFGFYTITNLVFLTSSLSTIDSTFSSTAKLAGLELMGFVRRGRPSVPIEAVKSDVWLGRISMVVMAVVGTLPLLQDPAVLNATTISGTIVMGLGPPVLFCGIFKGYRPLAFHIPFWAGALIGITYQLSIDEPSLNLDYSRWAIGSGSYAGLFGVNLYGAIMCFGLYFLCLLENTKGLDFPGAKRRWVAVGTEPADDALEFGTNSKVYTASAPEAEVLCKSAVLGRADSFDELSNRKTPRAKAPMV